MTAERDYHEEQVAQAQREVDAAVAKVEKLRAHLAGAELGVDEAQARLAAVRDGDHPQYVEPSEHATVQAQ